MAAAVLIIRRMEFYRIYNPITAMPFRKSREYTEIAPCGALRPYVRCFWGSELPYRSEACKASVSESLVTPDTCMDVIFDINHTNGSADSCFCGIDDRSFTANGRSGTGGVVSTFGIRFYAWSAALFAEDSMRGTRNARIDAGAHFGGLKKYLEPRFYESTDILSRIKLAEKYLLEHLGAMRENSLLSHAIGFILAHEGALSIKELAGETCISERRLERIFGEYIGVSPKKLARLVRYQYLWNSIVYAGNYDIHDLVYRFGYTDQAHLLRDFKRFHTMTPSEAVRHAHDSR